MAPPDEVLGSFTLVNSKTTYIAGETITLQFKGNDGNPPQLWVHTAYGSSVLQPDSDTIHWTFTLPQTFAKKAGTCSWELLQHRDVRAMGKITILPHTQLTSPIASYLGPRSITAGGDDFSMLVTAPTDRYDNPLVDSTSVKVTRQFGGEVEETSLSLKNGIGWENFYSTEQAGRLLIATALKSFTGKELTAMVHPAKATEFNITYRRNHSYADGHQVITLVTDIIEDAFGNRVSEGTLVNFQVINDQGMQLWTMGTTINGQAKGELLHPEIPAEWTVEAFITGAARSNMLSVNFEPALGDFRVSFSSDGRTATLSNLRSFMGQLIPDGMEVSLQIHNANGELLETLRATSRLGTVQFELPKDFYPSATYAFTFQVGGMSKTITQTLR